MRGDIGGTTNFRRDAFLQRRKILRQLVRGFRERAGCPPQFAGDGV